MKGKKLLFSLFAVVVLLAVMATPVMAATTTEITGTVPNAVEVTAPAGFDLETLTVGDNTTSTGKDATVDANHTGWTLTIGESGDDGKMSGVPGTLTNAMAVKGGDLGETWTSLATTPTLESDGASGTGQTITVYFRQFVAWTDAAGDYSITVTFTVSPATP